MTDKNEFCLRIQECEHAMYSLAYSIVKNDADAQDVISESIYCAFYNLPSLRNDSAFKTWILKIVHNTAIETIRKNSRLVNIEEIDNKADNSLTDATTKIALKNAVEHLNEPYSTVITLFYYEGFSVNDISKITGANSAAVRKQLSRARKMLKEVLKEDFINE